jgi:hypothetical protein
LPFHLVVPPVTSPGHRGGRGAVQPFNVVLGGRIDGLDGEEMLADCFMIE